MSRQIFWDVSKKWKSGDVTQALELQTQLECCVFKLSWVFLKDSCISLAIVPGITLTSKTGGGEALMVRRWCHFPPKITIYYEFLRKMSWSKMSSFFLKKDENRWTQVSVDFFQTCRTSNKSSSPTSILEVTLGDFMKQLLSHSPPLTPKISNSLSWRVFKTTLIDILLF